MNRRAVLWGILLAVLAFLGYFLLILAARGGAFSPRGARERSPSTYGVKAENAKAVYLFLRRCGVASSRRRVSWQKSLPRHGLLVVPEPIHQPDEAERAALRRWVAGGGTALFFGSMPWNLWPIGGTASFGAISMTAFRPLVPSGLMAGVEYLHLEAAWRLKGPFSSRLGSPPPVILAGDARGGALFLATCGQGRVILAADRGFLANGRLKEAPDNALFLLNLARSFGISQVQFDEYHLGYGYRPEDPAAKALARLPVAMEFLEWQLLFLVTLYFLMVGKRFGRPMALPETGGRTITEYITSLATLYQRARAGSVALDHLYHGLVERMRLSTGLPANVQGELLARTVAERLGWDPHDLQRLMVRCQAALAQERVAPGDLLALARRIDYYRKELEKWVTLPRS